MLLYYIKWQSLPKPPGTDNSQHHLKSSHEFNFYRKKVKKKIGKNIVIAIKADILLNASINVWLNIR